LAHFYHDLGCSGRILDPEMVSDVTSVLVHDLGFSGLQGATSTVASHTTKKNNNNNNKDGDEKIDADDQRTSLGCGYQLIRFDKDDQEGPSAFGHAGVGGSIGFHHKPTGISVGIMLNKADSGNEETKSPFES
jgi:hypothetical protein